MPGPSLRPDEARERDTFREVPVELRQDVAQARNVVARMASLMAQVTEEGRKLRILVYRMKMRGYGAKRIGRYIGLSDTRVHQLIREVQELEKAKQVKRR